MAGKHLLGYCSRLTNEKIKLLSSWAGLNSSDFTSNQSFTNISITNVCPEITLSFKGEIPEELHNKLVNRTNFVRNEPYIVDNTIQLYVLTVVTEYQVEWKNVNRHSRRKSTK